MAKADAPVRPMMLYVSVSAPGSAPVTVPITIPPGLFSGIADPEGFEETVEELSVNISGRIRYPDHHQFGEKEVKEIKELAEKSDATALLTTEKDGFRWPMGISNIPCYVLRMDPVFMSGEKVLMEKVLSLIES